jgi:O-antigen/teichoic acid export membrane protein
MVLKLTENFADVFHGIAQRNWRLDIAGKSFILRGALIVISFTVGFILTDNLAVAIIAMATTNLLSLILYDYIAIKKTVSLNFNTSAKRILTLSLICLPMVGYGLCIHSITPIAKCLLEAFHGTENLGYYSSITTVSSLIQSFSVIIFTPLIGLFAQYYEKNEKRKIAKLLIKLFAMISGITAVAMLCVLLFGDFAMVLVFGKSIRPYVYLLYPTVIASAFTALVWLIGMVLVVMRNMKTLLFGALAGLVISVGLSLVLIPSLIFEGTNIAIICGFFTTCVIYLIKLIQYLASKGEKDICNKESGNGTENT